MEGREKRRGAVIGREKQNSVPEGRTKNKGG